MKLKRKAVVESGLRNPVPAMESLLRTVTLAQGCSGQSKVVARALLSTYNGERFPFDLTELAKLDIEVFADLSMVFSLRQAGYQTHRFLIDGENIYETIALDWGFEDTPQ